MAHLKHWSLLQGGFVSDFLHISWTIHLFSFSKYVFIDFRERKWEGERDEASMMRNIDHGLLYLGFEPATLVGAQTGNLTMISWSKHWIIWAPSELHFSTGLHLYGPNL